MPVEIAIASVSPVTVRITVAAIVGTGGVPDDGALVARRGREAAGRGGAADGLHAGSRREPDACVLGRPAGDSRSRRSRGSRCSGWSLDAERARHSLSAAEGTAARARRGRAAVRSQGLDRSDAERSGRLSAQDARRARADPVAGRHRRLGDVRPPSARRVRLHRRRGHADARRQRRCRSTCSSSRRRIRR